MHCQFNGNAFTKPTIYYMSNTNNLQLYRNDVYFNDKTAAKDALQSQLETSSDGELVISRYAVKDDNGAVTDVKTLFGFAASGASGVFTTIFDYDDLSTNSKLEELKFNDVIATWNEEKTSLTVLVSAANIKTSSGYTPISYGTIGDTTFERIGAEESIESALSKIESNISTLIQVIIENEFVTANSLTKFNESAGFNSGEYSADENDAHLSGATSLKHADTLLSEAIDSVEGNLQSQADRITQLENNSSIIGSDTITIKNSTVSIAENLDIYCGEY